MKLCMLCPGLQRFSRHSPRRCPMSAFGTSIYDCHGLVHCQNLCHASAHEGECIQDLHPFIHEGVHLHSDCNLDGSHKLLSFITVSAKWLGVGHFSTPDWVMRGLDRYAGLGVHNNSLCHRGCCGQSHIGDVIAYVCYATLEEGIQFLKLLHLCYDLFQARSRTRPCTHSAPDRPPTFHCRCAPHRVMSCDPLPSHASTDVREHVMAYAAPSGLCSFLTCPIVHCVV